MILIPAKMETAPTFLEVQALQWENDSNYNFLKKALSKMQVVNDSAERATLLAKTIGGQYRGTFLVPVPVPSVLLWYRYRQKIAKYRGTVPVL